MSIAIVGAGGHGRVALECLELSCGIAEGVAFYDDRWEGLAAVDGLPIYGPVDDLATDARFDRVFVGVGDNRARRRISLLLARAGKTSLTIRHPRTTISPRAAIGEGSIAVAGTVVNRDACVGRDVILNTICSIGHDCVVDDYAQVSPGVNLGGACVVGEGAFLGVGVKVVTEARIGAWSIVGAGTVVLGDLPERSFCVGVPAKVVRPLREDELPGMDGSSG